MPDYTIEVIDVEPEPNETLHNFTVEGVQAVTLSRQEPESPNSPHERVEREYTRVPVYEPPDPEQFSHDIHRRLDPDAFFTFRVLESDGSELVSGGVAEAVHVVGIASGTVKTGDGETIEDPDGGGPIPEGLFFLLFGDVADGIPSIYHGPGEPPYPTPWGREVGGLGYCW